MEFVLTISIFIFSILVASIFASSGLNILFPAISQEQTSKQKEEVTITIMLDDQGDPPRLLRMLFEPALRELQAKHPDLNIKLDYRPIPYLDLRPSFLQAMTNKTSVDIMTVDYIWLGEFVEKGFLTDITNYTKDWGRASDWYEANLDGGSYNDKIYGIWTVVDARGIWYWKDLLQQAGVDPNSLKTWDGYIEAAKKLNQILRPQGIEGVHLVGAGHSPDIEFFPYLWMQGGAIIENRPGHPTKGLYWFPGYNDTEGVRTLQFIKDRVDAGIKPQTEHFWGKEFLDKKFAVMIEALQNHVHLNTTEQKRQFEQRVGFIPGFPVPALGNQSATLLGGWLLSIPSTSNNKDLAWELITLVLQPKILAPFHQEYGLLPTQIDIGEGSYSTQLNQTVPYYDQLISMLELQGTRPNIPEYPEIAAHIKEAIEQVYNGTKEPEQALDEAAAKSAKVLGW
ncbi:MAG: extracellular solute-binding protein [Thermoproteota archaeon]|nr:extracellular solute-binding protein [Thermoproteota archaeon]